ncbi:MAG TPA: SGNH/GDSL hydrolase family protein [Capsulimonadaceae bacterium]|jgi:lysophospholipase L1-like esterase
MKFTTRIAAVALIASAAFGVATSANAQAFALKDGDHVVTYGDSITAQCLYSNFAEAFVLTRFPKLKIDWTTAGWGGDRVGGGGGGNIDLRLQRDVLAYNPTMVTVMLGMNDGGYKAFDQPTFDTYTKGYQHIIDVVKKASPATNFTIIQPSAYDDVTQVPKFPGGYNATLIKYSDAVKDLAQKNNFLVADLNSTLVDTLTKANAVEPDNAKKIVPDRVHPSAAGHLTMAQALVKAWNFPATVTAVSIDGAAGKVVKSDNTTVSKIVATPTLKWDQLDNALPLPINFNDPLTKLVVKVSDVVTAIDQEPLTVTNLTAAKYNLNIDGKLVGTFTKEDLAAGVNLATLPTPMYDQAMKVQALTNSHVGIHFNKFHNFQAPFGNDSSPGMKDAVAQLVKDFDTVDQLVVTQQRAAAQPVVHHFELVAAP